MVCACMQDWERETHMTKEDWARTCRRVVDERINGYWTKPNNDIRSTV